MSKVKNTTRETHVINNQVVRRLTKPEKSAVKILLNKLNEFLISKGLAGNDSDLKAGVTTGNNIFFMIETKGNTHGPYHAIGGGRYRRMNAAEVPAAKTAMWKICEDV